MKYYKDVLNQMNDTIKSVINAVQELKDYDGCSGLAWELDRLQDIIEKMNTPVVIKAEDVKYLRERTGEGLMACKQALEKAEGDVDKALALL